MAGGLARKACMGLSLSLKITPLPKSIYNDIGMYFTTFYRLDELVLTFVRDSSKGTVLSVSKWRKGIATLTGSCNGLLMVILKNK